MKSIESAPIDKQVFWPALIVVVVAAIVPADRLSRAECRRPGSGDELHHPQVRISLSLVHLRRSVVLLWFAFGKIWLGQIRRPGRRARVPRL